MESPRIRRWAWRALGVILVVVGAITFWPTPVDRPLNAALERLLSDLHTRGLPVWINYALIESAANVAMFMPLGAFIAIIASQSFWWVSGLLGLIASLMIELGQALFLPERFSSFGDVAANTAGAILGGGVIAIIRLWVGRASGRRSDEEPSGP